MPSHHSASACGFASGGYLDTQSLTKQRVILLHPNLVACVLREFHASMRHSGVPWAAMWGGRTSEQWVEQYATSHRHPVNRACHTLGIPTILVSLVLFGGAIFLHPLLKWAIALFLIGWTLQFVGHAFERKEPEFFHDWRFLFVGVRWWLAKIRGRA